MQLNESPHAARTVKIAVIEEHTLFRDCLVRCLSAALDYDVMPVESLEACVEDSKQDGIGLYLLFIPDGAKGDEKWASLSKLCAQGPTVVVSAVEEPQSVIGAIEIGARGYIPTTMSLDAAIAAIKFVASGGVFVPAASLLAAGRDQTRAAVGAKEPNYGPFTARQAAVVEALRRGKANKLIAHELNMCESTVKVHVRKIMKKLKVTNRTQVAFRANEILNGSFISADRHGH